MRELWLLSRQPGRVSLPQLADEDNERTLEDLGGPLPAWTDGAELAKQFDALMVPALDKRERYVLERLSWTRRLSVRLAPSWE